LKVLVTGADGQLGRALQQSAPAAVEVIALGRRGLDLTDRAAIVGTVAHHRPDLIFNAAAYTAVDRAESEESAARLINATAVGELARATASTGARFVHVSTDFVFDGASGRPYRPKDPTGPLGVYGRTKLEGEQAAGPDALIIRTSWVYAPAGTNFVRTMLRLMGERPELDVVADQIGSPTYAPGLASALWALALQDVRGILHYTDSGVASWYDFAEAIQEEALAIGLLDRAATIKPIATEDYPTPARRPSFSVLDKADTWRLLGGAAPHWRVNLRTMLGELKRNG
jgi:dTDP-4-dehydrorhamnose reductase